jgi:hypothetical protein
MARMQFVGLVTAGVLACMSTSPVLGQSLADIAKRAEEQRQERPNELLSFKNSDLTDVVSRNNREVVTLELALPLLERYYGVRTAILREMVKSPALARRIRSAIGSTSVDGGVAIVEREYGNEPAVVEAIRAGNMTTHDYVITETAFMAAVGILAGKLPASAASTGAIGRNIEFLKRHQPEVEALWQEASPLEERLARPAAAAPPKPSPAARQASGPVAIH